MLRDQFVMIGKGRHAGCEKRENANLQKELVD